MAETAQPALHLPDGWYFCRRPTTQRGYWLLVTAGRVVEIAGPDGGEQSPIADGSAEYDTTGVLHVRFAYYDRARNITLRTWMKFNRHPVGGWLGVARDVGSGRGMPTDSPQELHEVVMLIGAADAARFPQLVPSPPPTKGTNSPTPS